LFWPITNAVNGKYALETSHHRHLVLECMRLLKLTAGEIIRLEEFHACGLKHGFNLAEMGNALIEAGANGWIRAADHHIQLTESGYRLLYPANDNLIGSI